MSEAFSFSPLALNTTLTPAVQFPGVCGRDGGCNIRPRFHLTKIISLQITSSLSPHIHDDEKEEDFLALRACVGQPFARPFWPIAFRGSSPLFAP
jgi:hypothetical protein